VLLFARRAFLDRAFLDWARLDLARLARGVRRRPAFWLFSRIIGDALFATSPSDPEIYLAVGGVLFAVASMACYLPARRASETDPARLLRA
jgi:hypothetical protein